MHTIDQYSSWIEAKHAFSTEELLVLSRLWNTLLYYTGLQQTPAGERLFRLVRDEAITRIVESLEMEVSRGFAYQSRTFDMKLGGLLEERYRYTIEELENQGA